MKWSIQGGLDGVEKEDSLTSCTDHKISQDWYRVMQLRSHNLPHDRKHPLSFSSLQVLCKLLLAKLTSKNLAVRALERLNTALLTATWALQLRLKLLWNPPLAVLA